MPSPLFAHLIDDAGLFPPARKPMERAAADHRRAQDGPHAWMLGRFLCPASRLGELAGVAGDGWGIGVVLDGASWEEDLERVRARSGPGTVRVLELKLPYDAAAAAQALREAAAEVFFEVPGAASVPEVAELGVGAKLRCGGASPDLFPGDAGVAAFIAAVREAALPFKLTAGLHHPFRVRDAAIGVLQHGFVNLLAATALDVDDLEAVVAEQDPVAFAVGRDGSLRWRDATAGPPEVARARSLFTAYGSCSFDEPVDDLIAYGILDG